MEPNTPSPRHTKPRMGPKKSESSTQKVLTITSRNSIFGRWSGIDPLWWRNRKPFRRAAKKRAELDSLLFIFP